MHFVSKCSEPARLKKRSLFEQARMLHNSRNISDGRIQQHGFYQLVQAKGEKGTGTNYQGEGPNLLHTFFSFIGISYVIWQRFVVRAALATSGHLVFRMTLSALSP